MTERILILNISGIGDFIDSTPALKYARTLRPDAQITLVVSEKASVLAKRCPYVNEVIALPTSAGTSFPRWQDLPRWLRQAGRLRGRFDTALNLYGIASARGARFIRFLVWWSGAPLAAFDNRSLRPSEMPRDQMEFSIAVVSRLEPGRPFEGPPHPEIWIANETIADVQNWVRTLPGTAISVFLGGERRTRHEFPERADEWLSQIQERLGVHPIILGAKTDPGLPEASRVKFTDMRGKTDLERTAAIIASSAALITTHSAPQHLASVWNTPTVVLVGPGDEARYRPHVDPDRLEMLRHPVSCSPCYYGDCPLPIHENKKCMTGISPESVVQAFTRVFRH